MSSHPPSTATFLIIAFAIAVLGLFQLIRGFRGRRIGLEKRCKTCSYIVDGLDSDRCPECGRVLSAEAVVQGVRKRRVGAMTVGIIALLLSLSFATILAVPSFRRFDYYDHMPVWWVMRDLDSTDPKVQLQALTQLQTRDRAGALTAAQASELIDKAIPLLPTANSFNAWQSVRAAINKDALTPAQTEQLIRLELNVQQTAWPVLGRSIYGDELMDFLGAAFQKGLLSDEQKEAMFTAAARSTFTVRPNLIKGRDLPYRIADVSCGPSIFYVSRSIVTVFGPGRESSSNYYSMLSASPNMSSSGGVIPITANTPLGHQTAKQHVRIAIFQGRPTGNDEGKTPLWSREDDLTAPYDLLDGSGDDGCRLIDVPELADAMRKCTHIERCELTGKDYVNLNVAVDKPSMPVAYDVVLVIDGQETKVSSLTAITGNSSSGCGFHLPKNGVKQFDVILRSSVDALRGTTDSYTAWKGEIVFRNVTIVDRQKPK